jgi:hypothetical protein
LWHDPSPRTNRALRMTNRLTITTSLAGAALFFVLALDSTAGGTTGRPFRVSKSVTEYCAMKPVLTMCEAFEPQLAQFLAESRDERWAPSAEKLIAKSMLVNGRPWVEIRALECRRTRCAIEYAVSIDDLDHDVDGNAELDQLMEPIGGVTAPELASGSRKNMMVSVMIWRKRSVTSGGDLVPRARPSSKVIRESRSGNGCDCRNDYVCQVIRQSRVAPESPRHVSTL